jgi:hypothetical protein
MESQIEAVRKNAATDTLLVILVLGSLWGFSEVVLSETIKIAGIPFRAGILTGIGMGIMGIAVAMNRKTLPLLGIALVTVAAKELVVPILHCSFMCKANSCAAVLLQGLALSSVIVISGHRIAGGVFTRAIAGASAALLSAGAFYYVGINLAPCAYLLSFASQSGIVTFMGAEGIVWAAFSAVFFPIGCAIGARLLNLLPAVKMQKPAAYYLFTATGLFCCWAAIAASTIMSA